MTSIVENTSLLLIGAPVCHYSELNERILRTIIRLVYLHNCFTTYSMDGSDRR